MSLPLITESGPNKVACWQGLLHWSEHAIVVLNASVRIPGDLPNMVSDMAR